MKYFAFLLVSIVLFQAAGVHAQGRLFCDEICGSTDEVTNFSSIEADLYVANRVVTTEFQGTLPEGFGLETVGGIRVAASGDTTVTSETDISISTPISGILEIFGAETEVGTGGSFTITANDDVLIDAELINFSTGSNTTGDIIFDSNLSTSFEGVNGVSISSLFRDVNFLAPTGTVSIASDILTFVSGDTVDDQRLTLDGREISIHTDGTFDINSGAEISLVAEDDVFVESRSRDLTLEAFNELNFVADNINLEATSFVELNSLIGDIQVSAADTAGFYGFSALFLAEETATLSGNSVDIFSTGNVGIGFFERSSVDISAVGDISYMTSDTGSVTFRGVTGDLSLSAQDLNLLTDSLFIVTGEAPGNAVDISASNSVTFASDNEDIRFDGSAVFMNAENSLSVSAGDNLVFLMNDEHSENPLLSSDAGHFFVNAGDISATVFDAAFQSDTSLTFSMDSIVLAGSDAEFRSSFGEFFNTQNSISVMADDISVSSAYDIAHTSSTYDVVAGGDAEVTATLYDLSIVTETFSSSQDSNEINAPLGRIIVDASDFTVVGGDVVIRADDRTDQVLTLVSDLVTFQGASGDVTFSADVLNYATGGTFAAGSDLTNSGVTFSGGDQYFESDAGDIAFTNVELAIEGTEAVSIRSDDVVTVGSGGNDLVIEAPSTSVDSDSDLTLTGDTLTIEGANTRFSAAGLISWEADDELNLTGTGPNGSVTISGGEITHTYTSSIDFFAETADLSANGRVVFSSTVDGSTSSFSSSGTTSFTAGFDSNSGIIDLSTDDFIVSGSSLSYNSEARESISFTVADDYTLSVDGDFAVTGDSMDLLAGFDFSLTAVNDVTHATTVSTEMFANGDVSLSTPADVLVTGDVVTFDFDGGDSVIDVGGDSNSAGCGNIDFFVSQYEFTTMDTLTVSQVVDPCGDEPTRMAGDFRIVTHAEDEQFFTGDGDFNVDTTESLTIRTTSVANAGGISLFAGLADPTLYGISFNSSTAITIDSQNTEYEFALPRDDRLDAPLGEILATADGWIKFEANGFENNFNTQNFGVFIQTAEAPLRDSDVTNDADVPVESNIRFESLDGTMLVESEDLLRIGTSRPLAGAPALQRLDAVTAGDILLDAGAGALFVRAGGALSSRDDLDDFDLDDFDLRADSSLHLYAHSDDISASSNGSLLLNGRDGLSFESTTESIAFQSSTGISAHVSSVGGSLSFFSEFGNMPIDASAGDISFFAGNNLQEAEASFSASSELIIASAQNQQYRSYGALVSPDQIAINLVGEDGPVSFASAEGVTFLSSGSTRFDAGNGDISVSMTDDIALFSNARANFTSQFSSSATVQAGDLAINALGGGGSVDIQSDSNQDLVGTAGDSITVSANNDVVYAARTGIAASTNNGDIDVIQRGNNQDTLVHSEGTVLLQADGPGGIRIAGRNVVADAVNDINVDAANFNVGSAGNTNTATEPLVVVRGGGDSDTNGLNVISAGNIDWTTSEVSVVEFEANALDFNVGGDFTIRANGVFTAESLGHLDDGLFTLSAGDVLTLAGGEAAILHGETSNTLSTAGSISFQNIGTDAEDAFVVHSSNNFFVSGRNGVGGSFVQTADDIVGEFRDFQVIAGDVTMTSTPGNGGHFTFDSDTHIYADSIGDITVQASDDITVTTAGENSNVEFVSGGETTVTSSGSLAVSSTSFDMDAREGVDILANGGELSITASDDISIIANATATFTSRNTITIETGYAVDETTTSRSFLNITSRGSADFISVERLQLSVEDASLSIEADQDLLLANSMPLRARDQGDVTVAASDRFTVNANGDHIISADRNLEVFIDGEATQSNSGDINFIATGSNADIRVQADGDLTLESEDTTSFAAGTSSIVADLVFDAEDFELRQLFEENYEGGIRVSSTGANAITSFQFTETADFEAGVAILGTSDAGYGRISVAESLSFQSTRLGAAAVFESSASDLIITADTVEQIPLDVIDVSLIIAGRGTGSNDEPSVLIQSDTRVGIDNNNSGIDELLSNAINVSSGDRIVLDQPLEDGNRIFFDSVDFIDVVADGMSDETNQFGIQIEADELVEVEGDIVHVHANGVGSVVSIVASETFEATTDEFFAHGGDSLVISTGFTPPLNANLAERRAIIFDSDDLEFASTHRDVVINAEDVSWDVNSDLTITAAGVGSGVTFSVDNAQASMDLDGDVNISADQLQLISGGDLSVSSDDNVSFTSRDGVFINAEDDISINGDSVDFLAADQIVLLTPEGHVTFSPNSIFEATEFLMPALEGRAGVGDYLYRTSIDLDTPFPDYDITVTSADGGDAQFLSMYRFTEGNGQSACPNRAFGFDEETYDMCVCISGQWSCARSSPSDLVYLNNSGFFN